MYWEAARGKPKANKLSLFWQNYNVVGKVCFKRYLQASKHAGLAGRKVSIFSFIITFYGFHLSVSMVLIKESQSTCQILTINFTFMTFSLHFDDKMIKFDGCENHIGGEEILIHFPTSG